MLNILSVFFGLLAALFSLPGLIPFFGILNWVALPIAGIGAGIGALASGNFGRNLNLVIFGVAAVRLTLGGGLL